MPDSSSQATYVQSAGKIVPDATLGDVPSTRLAAVNAAIAALQAAITAAQAVLATHEADLSAHGLDGYVKLDGTRAMTGPFSAPNVPMANYYGFVPANFLKWRKALANVLIGAGDAKILCIGDSTTWGYGSSNVPVTGYPGRLAAIINQGLAPASAGGGIAPSYLTSTPDARWTAGGNWAKGALGWGKNSCWQASITGDLVFTPGDGASYDSFDVYYLQEPGLGTLTVTATGGTPSVVDANTGPNGTAKVTVAAASAGTSNSVAISNTSGANFVVAIQPFHSTTRRVRILDAGVNSSYSADWADATNFHSIQQIEAYAPDLAIFSVGINDANASIANATVQVNMAITIAAAKLSGDVMLCTMPPSSGSGWPAFEAAYAAGAYRSLSASTPCALVDLYARFGGAYQADYMFDALHPNDQGYADWAAAMMGGLRII